MLRIGNARQLFLDDFVVAELRGVVRTLHQPTKYENNPVVVPEHPWEDQGIHYPLVFRDGSIYRMYYLARGSAKDTPDGSGNFGPVGYAESQDGIHWTKPLLDVYSLPGHPKTSLGFALTQPPLRQVEGPAIIKDERDPDPQRRYKLFFSKGRDRVTPTEGFSVAFSPDGLRWKEYDGNPVYKLYGDTQNCLVWDPEIERWVAFVRMWGKPSFQRPVWFFKKYRQRRIRFVARMSSADFEHWTPSEVVLTPDPSDSRVCDFYGIQVTYYEGLYIGFLWVLTSIGGEEPGSHGYLNAQLVTSRDHGLTWHRVCGRKPVLDRGKQGSFDFGGVYPVPFVTEDKEHLVYYKAIDQQHGVSCNSTIALSRIRRDGFVSLDAFGEPGEVVTHALEIPSQNLHLNADISDGGSIEVHIETPTGKPVAQGDASYVVRQPGLDVAVLLRNVPSTGAARLRFILRNASLYSFWFAG